MAHTADPLSAAADGLLVVSRFVRLFPFHTIRDVVLMIDRERSGRNAHPSAAIIAILPRRWVVERTLDGSHAMATLSATTRRGSMSLKP
jgi:hypothetical protein